MTSAGCDRAGDDGGGRPGSPEPIAVDCDVLVVGAGFAGSILARTLARRGRTVCLVERGEHPRFALGESSTPLANLSLERLALLGDMKDLYELSAWGRWKATHPELMCGLKRGFSFYSADPHRRAFYVAASPDDAIADCQWLRADVDHHLVRCALDDGALYLDRLELTELDTADPGFRAAGERAGAQVGIRAGFVVDATGGQGFLEHHLGLAQCSRPIDFRSRLLYSHFAGLPPFRSARQDASADRPPYRAEWSAVHVLVDVGWMYQLRFDDGTTSAGFVVDEARAAERGVVLDWSRAERCFSHLLQRYDALALQFEGSRALRPLAATGRLQRRLQHAAGHGWALLPHSFAFYDPLYSTGMAWSLLAVERLADVLGEPRSPAEMAAAMRRYDRLLASEADHLQDLMTASYSVLDDVDDLAALSLLYFAAASFDEAAQRLLGPAELEALLPAADECATSTHQFAWRGFLGATDPILRSAFGEAVVQARRRASGALDARQFERWVLSAIADRDVAGWRAPSEQRSFAVDLGALERSAHRYGLSAQQYARRRGRLRSPSTYEQAAARVGGEIS